MFSSRKKSVQVTADTPLIPGLVNPSANCYLNSSLQLLASSSYLHEILPKVDAESGSASHTSPALQSLLDTPYPPELPLTASLNSILQRLWTAPSANSAKKNQAIAATQLQRQLCTKNEDYDGKSQQDAHELLLTMLDQMRLEEVDLIKKVQPPVEPTRKKKRKPASNVSNASGTEDDTESSSSENEVTELPRQDDGQPRLEPFVDTLFGGRLASFIVCDACQHVSISSEPFVDISVAVTPEQESGKGSKRNRLRSLLTKSSPSLGRDSDSSPTTPKSPRSQTQQPASSDATDSERSDKESSEDARVWRRRSLNIDKRSLWGNQGRNAKSREASPDRSGLISLRRSTSSSSATKAQQVSEEQRAYIKSVLAEVPTHTGFSPLELLRVAQPHHNSQNSQSGTSNLMPQRNPPSEDVKTGLYAALQRFTAVEVLEGENAFKCKNCWKLAHPEFTKLKRKSSKNKTPFHPSHSPLGLTSNSEEDADERSNLMEVASSHVGPLNLNLGYKHANNLEIPPSSVSSSSSEDLRQSDPVPSIVVGAASPFSEGIASSTGYYASDVESPVGSDDESTFSVASSVPRAPKKMKPKKADRVIAQKAHKRFLISHLPPILLIHFNRFQQTKSGLFTSSFSNLKKMDDFVSFPLLLNMTPFLAPLGKPPSAGHSRREHGLMPKTWPSHKAHHHDTRVDHSRYRLCAIVVHNGTMGSGHYICFVNATKSKSLLRVESMPDPTLVRRDLQTSSETGSASVPAALDQSSTTEGASLTAVVERDREKVDHTATKEKDKGEAPANWLYCSDEEVRSANISEVLQCKAYILLYEQI